MNLNAILSMADNLLPQNSPWRQKISQAKQIADQFPASKGGVEQLMRQYGKSREDVRSALSMLNNPAVANTLGRIPGVGDTLKSYGSKILETSKDTVQGAPVTTESNDILSRLSRLK